MAENQTKVDGSATQNAGTSVAEESELDRLTAEFEKSLNVADPAQAVKEFIPQFTREIAPLAKYVKDKQEAERIADIENDIGSAMKFVADGDEYKDVDQRFVRGYLESVAREDRAFLEAFNKRKDNPAAWSGALEKAKESFRESVGKLRGSAMRSDLEAATASVRGTSQTGSKAPAFDASKAANMSDREWDAFKRGLVTG